LEENPFFTPGKKIRKLEGQWRKKGYRIRVGDYRAIYYIEGEQINVVAVIHRKDLKKEISKLNL
jgi:mRNA-degrading endonuclease RelE of RelBE toxin-antitoxin system